MSTKRGKSDVVNEEFTIASQKQIIPEDSVIIAKEKFQLIQSFFEETGDRCMQQQRAGKLEDESLTNQVANFMRAFYEITD